jgi:hypothetical protein
MAQEFKRTCTHRYMRMDMRRIKARIKRESEAALWLARLILPDVYKTN